MKIAINTRFLLNNKLEGIGWFTFETVKRIVEAHPEHEFYFFFDRPYHSQFIFGSNVKPIVLYPPARHPILWFLWFEFSVYRQLKKIKPDLFLSLDGYLSLRSKTKTIIVLHDLNFEHYPQNIKWLVVNYLRYFFPKFAQKAERIITVSNFSKADIINKYNIDPSKIDVAYNGASSTYRPLNKAEKASARDVFASGSQYFIYIGALLPRKNVARLLLAFDSFKESVRSDVKLVIVGAKMFKTNDIERVFLNMKYASDVIFTGRLAPGLIEKALGGALALTYVSYFEGFGIPLVEAMYADVPVITSNATSLPEVAGDAALIVDPFSTESIKNGMLQIYYDENLRHSLIEKGRVQRQKFSWEKTAEKLWQSILQCVESK